MFVCVQHTKIHTWHECVCVCVLHSNVFYYIPKCIIQSFRFVSKTLTYNRERIRVVVVCLIFFSSSSFAVSVLSHSFFPKKNNTQKNTHKHTQNQITSSIFQNRIFSSTKYRRNKGKNQRKICKE